ncbi:hypothetical protein VP382E491_P0013 [Vibrio phage 382E49-1]|nr:hypothetical protein VP382E491_P0013 [Vibrio phage 382E49-1]
MPRVMFYKNKTTVDYEFVAAMEVISDQNVKVVFKSGAVVTMSGYQGLATGFQEYLKSKYGDS